MHAHSARNTLRAAFLTWYGANRACAKWNRLHNAHFATNGAVVAFKGPDFMDPGLQRPESVGALSSRRWIASQFQAIAAARAEHGAAIGKEWLRLTLDSIRYDRLHAPLFSGDGPSW